MNPLDVALNRMAEIRGELAELETFVRVYYRMFPQEKLSAILPNGPQPGPVDKSVDKAVDKSPKPGVNITSAEPPIDAHARFLRRRRPTDMLATAMEDIMREFGRPMTRGELVSEIEQRDLPPLPDGGDKAKYLGTLLWRHREDRFRNLPGHGYWLKNEPYAPANYDPATDTEIKQFLESEAGFADRPNAPPELTMEVLKQYNSAVASVKEMREAGFEASDYNEHYEEVRRIERAFPQVMGGARQSMV